MFLSNFNAFLLLLLFVSVIIMCMHSILVGGEQQATFLLKAQKMGLTSGKYVFVAYDTLLYSLPYTNVSYFPLENSSSLREAYDAVLTITVASEPLSFNEAFAAAKRSEEVTLSVEAEQVGSRFTCNIFLTWLSNEQRVFLIFVSTPLHRHTLLHNI